MKVWRWALVALAISACGKKADFLNYVKKAPPTPAVERTYKIKELVGFSRADILWVIDNSRSMTSYQRDVSINTEAFMKGFVAKANVDWRMGLISTDTKDRPYVGFPPQVLDRSAADPVAVFQAGVAKLGNYGDGYEKTFDPTVKALTEHPDFLRKDALLILMVVTDAREQSIKHTAQSFVDFLKKAKGDIKLVTGYGILGPQDWNCPDTDSDAWNFAGSPYESFFQAVQGKTYKLCDPNFAQNLTQVGKEIGERIAQATLRLSTRPLIESLVVTHKGRELPGGPADQGGFWRYDSDINAILFNNLDFAPGDDEQVHVAYRTAGI